MSAVSTHVGASTLRRWPKVGALAACMALLLAIAPPADAVVTPEHGRVVSTDPASFTPDVLDGRVNSVAEVGDHIVIGGEFTQIQDGRRTYNRSNIAAFDRFTGEVSETFKPDLNGTVYSVLAAADGRSVYVGGAFDNTASQTSLVQLQVSDGSAVAAFNAVVDEPVLDLDIDEGRLFVGGHFLNVNGKARSRLAVLDAATGTPFPSGGLLFEGTHHDVGVTHVESLDVSPDGRWLLVTGNFATINGLLRKQIALFDVSGTTPTLTAWRAPGFGKICSQTSGIYIQDAGFAPTSDWFGVVTTGGYKSGPTGLCDMATRWTVRPRASHARPVWKQLTGGDSLTSVEITDTAMYVGGHHRWLNNPYAANQAGPGAIPQRGLSALDPQTGLPFPWGPTATLKLGFYDLLPTDQGLWLGSDYEIIGGEWHKRIALLPLEGPGALAKPAPIAATELPVDLYHFGDGSGADRTRYDGNQFGPKEQVSLPSGSGVAGAFAVSGTLYTAYAEGSLTRRDFSGSSSGSESSVDLHGDTMLSSRLESLGSIFYAGGRVYYTVTGVPKLFARAFLPTGDVVSALEETVTGRHASEFHWAEITQMFVASKRFYYVVDDVLWRARWRSTGPVPGSSARVDMTGAQRRVASWGSGALFAAPAS